VDRGYPVAVVQGEAQAVVVHVHAFLLAFVVGHDILAAAEGVVGSAMFFLVVEDAGL